MLRKSICFGAIFILILNSLKAQNQHIADSLKVVYSQSISLGKEVDRKLLLSLITYSTAPEDVMEYVDQLLTLPETSVAHQVWALRAKGVAYRRRGDLKHSIENLFLSSKLAIEHGIFNEAANSYLEIASTYSSNSQTNNALIYEKKAIEIIRANGTANQLATNLLNLGYTYYTLDQLDSALLYYNEAEPLFDSVKLTIGKAYVIGNRAMVYQQQQRYELAESGLLSAIALLIPLGDEFGMADYHNQLGKLYRNLGRQAEAIDHAQKAHEMALRNDLKEQVRDASLLLAGLFEQQNDHTRALAYQKQYIAFKDSIESAEKTREMADLRTEYEVNIREKEIDLLKTEQQLSRGYIILVIILLIFAVVLLLYFRQRFVNTRLLAERERERQDEEIENLLRVQETRAIQSMIVGREEERKRIAADLHNHLGSLMATIKVNVSALSDENLPNYPTLSTLVDQACKDVRSMSHTLNMGISEDFGLLPALRDLVNHLQQSGGLQVELRVSMSECQLGSESEILIYRIVQELVSNVLKHAHATRLSILLTCFSEDQLVNIMVQDNGRGFDLEKTENDPKTGMGLGTIRQMVQLRHGEISVDTNGTSGTTINIDLPIEDLNH